MEDRISYESDKMIEEVPRNCWTCNRMKFCDEAAPNHVCRKWSLMFHYNDECDCGFNE